MLSAKWIWAAEQITNTYNQTIIARKKLSVEGVKSARLRITADSAYRCFINGTWINDGPCRAWPEHYQYDEIDVASYLHPGENEICIIAKFWGVGTFHQAPQQAGLLAQLDLTSSGGQTARVITDESWEIAPYPACRQETPKVSIQMEPQELYDARLAHDLVFAPAAVLCNADTGPWQDLHPRDVPLLTKIPVAFKTLREANVVRRREDLAFCLPSARLAHPGRIEANHNVMQSGGMATILTLSERATLEITVEGLSVWVDGHPVDDQPRALAAGDHLLVAFVSEPVGHRKEKLLRIVDPPEGLRLTNPLDFAVENPWCYLVFRDFAYAGDDLQWPDQGHVDKLMAQLHAYQDEVERLGAAATGVTAFEACFSERALLLESDEMFVTDTHWRFLNREAIAPADHLVDNPTGMLYDTPEATTVRPSPDGDVELVLDLGEQNIGYYELVMTAEGGIAVDIYGVEYIAPDGTVQHTLGNRNGMRYITREGVNTFISFKRRAGRYIFVTLRNQTQPVTIRTLRLIESTYPVNEIGSFRCSDEALTQIWAIAARTLKLCMEDTFTDCPLYEQTLWVGDARNEAVFAYPVFGAADIARRCAILAAQSLERYPIVGSQVPTCWDVLLPAWSFLWSISIWDYYAYTEDRTFVGALWSAVIQNLEGAAALRDEASGLFAGPFWNMFDWSGIDDRHEIVLHNSMLMVGAIDAAQKCAALLDDAARATWLAALRQELTDAINTLWDPETRTYPDSIHEDGTLSESTSQHTSFLALLYDIIPEAYAADALANMLAPPEGMVQVGSPFAMMTFYEALEKAGRPEEIIQSIVEAYTPMLAAGATTVWEVFPKSEARPSNFPTRSHCHAWSSAPVLFLNRILLGIRPTAPAPALATALTHTTYEISPLLTGLSWAEGAVATVKGPLHVAYRTDGDVLAIHVKAPAGVHVKYLENETHQGLNVSFTVAHSQ